MRLQQGMVFQLVNPRLRKVFFFFLVTPKTDGALDFDYKAYDS